MRLLTIATLLMLCGFAVARGLETTAFAVAQARASAVAGANSELRGWYRTPGVASTALKASLVQSAAGTKPELVARRTDELSELLAARPLSAIDWLALAGVRVASRASREQVLAALTMSFVTGPNEGAVMLQRGIFVLLQWDTLPTEMQAQAIRDLAGAFRETTVRDTTLGVIKTVLAGKSADERTQIAAMLRAQQVDPPRLVQLGL